MAIYTLSGRPVTFLIAVRPKAVWVWGTFPGPRLHLDSTESKVLPFLCARLWNILSRSKRAWPSRNCPSVPRQCFEDRGYQWAPPPLLEVLQDAELSRPHGGWRGPGECHPSSPSSGFRPGRQSVPPGSSHSHRPSHHHPSLFPRA